MPDGDDMLREILIRIPPEPSSLPRAAAVCKRWLGIVTDPKFHRQFYEHHRKPPLLGFFSRTIKQGIVFNPILDPPDRIPHARFSVARYRSNEVLDCRHGRVLLVDGHWKKMVLVCDPITGEQRRVAIPPEFKSFIFNGAVVCADGNQGHVHGGCHSSPFKVVLISTTISETLFSVYSSETGGWGDLMSTAAPYQLNGDAGTLLGNTLYWLSWGDEILEFDLDALGLAVITGPHVTYDFRCGSRQIVRAEDGAIGFAILSYPHFQMWQRNASGLGIAIWVLWKTIEMDSIVRLPPRIEVVMGKNKIIGGYDEDTDAIFLRVNDGLYMVQLHSMQSRKLYGALNFWGRCHPFKSFYTPAIHGFDEDEALHD